MMDSSSASIISNRNTSILLFVLFIVVAACRGAFVGLNYGTDGDNLPTPQQVVEFLQNQRISHVRMFNYNAGILQAFAGSNIQVMIGIPNEEIFSVGQSNATAAEWVKNNIATYLPGTNITGVAVGSQVLTHYPQAAYALVPTMRYIHAALVAANLDSQVIVSTPHSSSLIQNSFPPSQAAFNETYSRIVIPSLLKFLADTQSFFMLNIYPQEIYAQNFQTMSIDYALFRPNSGQLDTVTNLLYTNVFDTMIDAAYSAMGRLNYTSMKIVVGEVGWPSKGDPAEIGVSVDNAATFNNNLVKHVVNNTGTPRRPGLSIDTYIYEMFNEDLREGRTSEKNYGIFYPDQTPVYSLDIPGLGAAFGSNVSGNGSSVRSWCVAKQGASPASLQAGLDWACGPGGADCSQIQPGQPCYLPNTVYDHASYAFNSYYQNHMMASGSCDFAGVALITYTDPSHGHCIFPTFVPSNGTSNGTMNPNGTQSSGVPSRFVDGSYPSGILTFGMILLVLW